MEKEFQLDDYVLQIIEDLLIMCRENVALVATLLIMGYAAYIVLAMIFVALLALAIMALRSLWDLSGHWATIIQTKLYYWRNR